MDPAQYTVHVSAPESGAASGPGAGGIFGAAAAPPPPRPPSGGESATGPGTSLGEPRNPSYLQRKLDIAHAWEQAHCPERSTEKYEWKRACDGYLRNVKERRQQREQLEREGGLASPSATAVAA